MLTLYCRLSGLTRPTGLREAIHARVHNSKSKIGMSYSTDET